MNGWLDVVTGVGLGLLVNECTEVSPWLAHKIVHRAAVIRQPDRVEDFAEARSATINDRPGKLFKLFTALGFLFAALAHRAAKPRPMVRPSSRIEVLRVRIQAAGRAGVLCDGTLGLGYLFTGDKPLFATMDVAELALCAVVPVMVVLPSPRSKMTLGWAVLLPTTLVPALLWIGTVPSAPLYLAVMIAPVYGVAQVVRASLRDSRLLAGIGSRVALSAVIFAAGAVSAVIFAATVALLVMFSVLLGLVCLGVVGGLYVGVGLLVIEHANKEWDAVMGTVPNAIPDSGRE